MLMLDQECQLSVYRPNPRQYVASIPQVIELVLLWCSFLVIGSRSGSLVSTSDRCSTQTQVNHLHLTVLKICVQIR